MARPEIKVTDKDRRLVGVLAQNGVPQRQIAALTCGGIDLNTLKKHFKRELVTGKAFANYLIGQALFESAMNGDTTTMIWWCKARMGWSAKT
jgi:hypothetical protein